MIHFKYNDKKLSWLKNKVYFLSEQYIYKKNQL